MLVAVVVGGGGDGAVIVATSNGDNNDNQKQPTAAVVFLWSCLVRRRSAFGVFDASGDNEVHSLHPIWLNAKCNQQASQHPYNKNKTDDDDQGQ